MAATRFDSFGVKREETKATTLCSGGRKAAAQAMTMAAATSFCRSRLKLTMVVASSTALSLNIAPSPTKRLAKGADGGLHDTPRGLL